jgi:hypothetical protein
MVPRGDRHECRRLAELRVPLSFDGLGQLNGYFQ